MVSDVMRRHLMAARQELLQQRNAIDADIIEIDRMLGGPPREEAAPTSTRNQPPAQAQISMEGITAAPEIVGKAGAAWRPVKAEDVPTNKVDKLVGSGASIEEAILGVLELIQSPMKTEDIVQLLTATGSEWQATSIRSQLARSFKEGKILRPKRGLYAALDDDSTPAEAGVESRDQSPLGKR